MARQYKSSIRTAQAQQTRVAILETAMALFIKNGYAKTSIREIAEESGAAERTIYATFGDKTTLLTAIADYAFYGGDDDGEGKATYIAQMKAMVDHEQRLRHAIHQTTLGWEQGLAEIGRMVTAAATADKQLQKYACEMVELRHQATRSHTELIIGQDLPKDAIHEQLIDELEAITSEEVYWILTADRKWNMKKYEGFVFDVFINTLDRYGIELDHTDT